MVSVRAIVIRMEGKEFEKIGVPFDNGAHLLCETNGNAFRPVWSAGAVDEFPTETSVRAELIPGREASFMQDATTALPSSFSSRNH